MIPIVDCDFYNVVKSLNHQPTGALNTTLVSWIISRSMIEKAALIIVNVLVCQASLQVVTILKMAKPNNSSRNSCSTQKLVRFILWNYHHTLSGCVPNVPVIGLPIWSAHQALDALPLAAKLEAICSKQSCDAKTILQNLWCLSANQQSEVALWCSLLAPPILQLV